MIRALDLAHGVPSILLLLLPAPRPVHAGPSAPPVLPAGAPRRLTDTELLEQFKKARHFIGIVAIGNRVAEKPAAGIAGESY